MLYRFFLVFQNDQNSASSAYRSARGEAVYEYGHQGMTGTIAETYDFIEYLDEIFSSKSEVCDFISQNTLTLNGKSIRDTAVCLSYDDKNYVFYGWAKCK